MKKKDVSVDVAQSVTITQSLDFRVDGYEDVIVTTSLKEKVKIKQTSDIDIDSEGGDINGFMIDVFQNMDIDQFSNVIIKVKEKGDQLFIKIKAVEKTKIDQDTDVNAFLTQDEQFDVNVYQTVDINQDSRTKIIVQSGIDIDIDVLLRQTALVNQDVDVTANINDGGFDVAIDAEQDADLAQYVGIGVSSGDPLIA